MKFVPSRERANDSGAPVLLGPPSLRQIFLERHPIDGSLWLMDEAGLLQRRHGTTTTTFDAPEHRGLTQLSPGAETIWLRTASGLTRLDVRIP